MPRDLYEAAALDGAGPIARFRYVTWPALSPVTLFQVIVNVIAYLQIFTRARHHGCRVVDLGGSRPWLSDGVLRFKMKWHPRLVAQWHRHEAACVRWTPGNAGIEAMLRREAPIARDRDAFHFVAASGAWPPVLVPAIAGQWPDATSVAPPPGV